MPSKAGTPRRVALRHERLSARQDGRADVGDGRRRQRRPQGRKVIGHLLQIGSGRKFEQIVHRRVVAPSVTEGDELVNR